MPQSNLKSKQHNLKSISPSQGRRQGAPPQQLHSQKRKLQSPSSVAPQQQLQQKKKKPNSQRLDTPAPSTHSSKNNHNAKTVPQKEKNSSSQLLPSSEFSSSVAPFTDEYVSLQIPGRQLAFDDSIDTSSDATATAVFQWLIAPLSLDSFYKNYFEKRPFAILRHPNHNKNKKKEKTARIITTRPLEEFVNMDSDDILALPQYDNLVCGVKEEERKESKSSSSSSSHYYADWFSPSDLLSLLSSSPMHYTTDIDITQYTNGKRITLNPPSSHRATAKEVQAYFKKGCSIRLLSPQSHSNILWRLVNILDESWGMQCGLNSYWTPKSTQGFAPHYDDVDIFVMQTSGSKRWRLYPPMNEEQLLALKSSRNFDQNELGVAIMDVWLNEGDFLYAPRGTIHQCEASGTADSMHLTLSTCLNSSWANYLSVLLPMAIKKAEREDVRFRQVLPPLYHKYMGAINSESTNEKREDFLDQTLELIEALVTGPPPKKKKERNYLSTQAAKEDEEPSDNGYLPFDEAADEVVLDYLHGCIKPWMSKEKQQRTWEGMKETIEKEREEKKKNNKRKTFNGKNHQTNGEDNESEEEEEDQPVLPSYLKPSTLVRLTQSNVARLLTRHTSRAPDEDNKVLEEPPILTIHSIADNERAYKAVPLSSVEVTMRLAPAVDALISAYPTWLQIQQLPGLLPEEIEDSILEETEEQMSIREADEEMQLLHLCGVLFESGLLEITNDQTKLTRFNTASAEIDSGQFNQSKEEQDKLREEEEEEEEDDDIKMKTSGGELFKVSLPRKGR